MVKSKNKNKKISKSRRSQTVKKSKSNLLEKGLSKKSKSNISEKGLSKKSKSNLLEKGSSKKSKTHRSKTIKKSKNKTTNQMFEDEKLDIDMPSRRVKMIDGAYHVGDKKYKKLVGSRDEVWQGIAYKTNHTVNALKRDDLFFDEKTGEVKSKVRSEQMKQSNLNPLAIGGYLQKKGAKTFKHITKKNK